MLKTLYSKFTLMTLLLMLGSLLIGFFLTNTYYHRVIKEPNDEKNVEIARDIVSYIESEKPKNLPRYLATIGDAGYQIYIVTLQGDEQFFGGEFREKVLDDRIIENVLNGVTYHGMRDFPRETFVTGYFANELNNTVGVPFHYEDKHYAMFLRPNIKLLFSEVHRLLGALMVAMAVLSLIGVVFVAGTLIRPIKKLTRATHRIAHENFDVPLEIMREDEIGQLATSFQMMTEKLQENDRMRKEFISNVSHDFQSPLLNIQGYTTLLKQDGLSKQEREDYSEIIDIETRRLSKLTKQLLLLTTLESTTSMKRKNYALDEQLKETVRKYRWRLEDKDIQLTYTIPPLTFYGDAGLLQNVWDNLLTNAIKYSNANGIIDIVAEATASAIILTINDTGIGMNREECARVFERFYRADTARARHGTGLGLPIVKEIIELHGGTIAITSEIDKGTTVQVVLPNVN